MFLCWLGPSTLVAIGYTRRTIKGRVSHILPINTMKAISLHHRSRGLSSSHLSEAQNGKPLSTGRIIGCCVLSRTSPLVTIATRCNIGFYVLVNWSHAKCYAIEFGTLCVIHFALLFNVKHANKTNFRTSNYLLTEY